jgi:hypothetical protein
MTQTITIAGKPFTAEPRYAEGHVLTANEANALNQTFFENLRNNFAGKAKDGGSQEDFDAYVSTYKFGERTGGGGGSRDPIEVEALNLGRDAIRKAITTKGGKISDYTAAAITKAAQNLIDNKPEYREKAKARVEEMRSMAGESISDDLLETLKAESEKSEAEGQTTEPEGAEASSEEAPASRKRRASAE